MLELKNINFNRDGKQILKDINLKLDSNKLYVITGPNGSGKSTLAKIIMGINTPDSGSIIYNNKDITNLKIFERNKLGIGFSFQQPVRFKGLKVKDLLSINNNDDELNNLLEQVGLDSRKYLDRELNNNLSGGELKRIEIASVLNNNDFIIFDEPEAGIDLWSFKDLVDLFKKYKSNNKTLLIISHQERILKIADEIVLLENGEISKSKDYLEFL